MKKTRAIILGGGISGLSLAYFLKKKDPSCEITLLEKTERLGGWVHTQRENYLFERGPRTFSVKRSHALLELCKELKIEDKLIKARKEAHARYLLHKGRLEKFPSNPLQFLFSPLTRSLIVGLFKEWKKEIGPYDESVWDFAARRFSKEVAELLFDPITSGIYAGNCKELSVRSCFPILKKWEETGSLTKGFFTHKTTFKSYIPKILEGSSLFSLEGGIEGLIDVLVQKTGASFQRNQEVERIEFGAEIKVHCRENCYQGDYLYFAVPAFEVGRLLEPHDGELGKELKEIPYKDMTLVHLGFKENVLKLDGFGYLVPRKENQEILGAVFDSKIFAEHQKGAETRVTFMIEGLKDEKAATNALYKHLNVRLSPDSVYVAKSPSAIPQYRVGHKAKIDWIEKRMKERFLHCKLLGNYLEGVSVNDCIQRARTSC